MRKKHIAIIGVRAFPANYPGISGIDVRMESIIKYFSSVGYTTDVYVRSWIQKKGKKTKNISIIPIFTLLHPFVDTLLYSFLASILTCFSQAQIVFYEGTGSFLLSFLPRLFGKKVVVTIHSLEWRRKKWNTLAKLVLKQIEKVGVLTANIIIVVNTQLLTYCKKKYKKKAVFIPFFVEKKQPEKNVSRTLDTFGVTKNKYILYLGRITPEKRIEWIIQAHQKVNNHDLPLLLVGNWDKNSPYSINLKKLIKETKTVQIIPHLTGDKKDALISSCKLFVLASEVEGMPVALCEVLSYQRPVLIPNLAGLKDLHIPQQNTFRTNSFLSFSKQYQFCVDNDKPMQYAYTDSFSKQHMFTTYETIIQRYFRK